MASRDPQKGKNQFWWVPWWFSTPMLHPKKFRPFSGPGVIKRVHAHWTAPKKKLFIFYNSLTSLNACYVNGRTHGKGSIENKNLKFFWKLVGEWAFLLKEISSIFFLWERLYVVEFNMNAQNWPLPLLLLLIFFPPRVAMVHIRVSHSRDQQLDTDGQSGRLIGC